MNMTSAAVSPGPSAQALNQHCFCRTLNVARLRVQLESDPSLHGLTQTLAQTHPHLFSSTVVFLASETAQQITQLVAAIERVVALPAYRAQALARAPALAQHGWGPVGACMGFDFHLSATGPQLIEINTNAGGLLLNVALARAQEACCAAMDEAFSANTRLDTLAPAVLAMFQSEWQHQRGAAPWRSVLIVDTAPATQYLAPEFELFRQLFQSHGVAARIADPTELRWHDGQLWHEGAPVDMVYNRLTDFHLAEPAHLALRQAYEAGAVVLTPNPHTHALYADKRNLIALSQPALLADWGVCADDVRLLSAGVPPTELVTRTQADDLWARRRQLFFKPVAGFGAKAAYRGDKLTRRVWDDILAGDFVAQALVPPGARGVEVDGVPADLKFDVRAYTYDGQIQLLAARMYAGQTTNFRTEGGGFAPVAVLAPLAVPGL
jgi:hypothetical protein